MTMVLFLAALLSADAGMTRAEAKAFSDSAMADLQADVVRANPAYRRQLLSTLLCDAQGRKASAEKLLMEQEKREGPQRWGDNLEDEIVSMSTQPVRRALDLAVKDVRDVTVVLGVYDLQPYPCGQPNVRQMVACFDIVSPAYCDQDATKVRVRAAEDLLLRLRAGREKR